MIFKNVQVMKKISHIVRGNHIVVSHLCSTK